MFIAVLNKSKRVSDEDVALMTGAVNWQMKWHVCPAWQKTRPATVFLNSESQVPPGSYVIGIFDTPDDPNALGWHTEDEHGNVYGRVFCNPTLDAGYKALEGDYSIASILSHEVVEAYVDPTVSDWAMALNGTLYAKEACDPVEADVYDIRVGRKKIPVSVSNFVLPSWFDSQGNEPYDQLEKLSAAFTMTQGGYFVFIASGDTQAQQKFGDKYPAWKRETKKSEFARTAKRGTAG